MTYNTTEFNQTGIYRILNKLTGDVYIGSASRSFRNRFNEHTSKLKNNKHHSIYLQRAWNKYGEENFKFEILQVVIFNKKEELIEVEQHYLDNIKPTYNMRLTADNNLGMKLREETKEKLRIINTGTNSHRYGKHHSEESKLRIKESNCKNKYKVTNPNGISETVTNLSDYCKQYNLSRSNLCNVIAGKRQHHKGYTAIKLS